MTTQTTPAQNKALFRSFVDAWNRRDTEQMQRCWSPDLIHHGRTGALRREQVADVMGTFMRAFPDLTFHIDQLVADGDYVAARMTVTATHRDDLGELRATGRRIEVSVMGQVRVCGGRIAEHWNVMDELHLMQQLGQAGRGLLDPVTTSDASQPTKRTGDRRETAMTGTPAAQRNIDLVREFQEKVMHAEDYSNTDQYLHPDLAIHLPAGLIPPGRDEAVKWFKQAADSFTSSGIEVKMMMADDDSVLQLIELHFVHTGDYMGLPATGKEFSIGGLAAFKIKDGKIAEHWGLYDMMSIPAQLGIETPGM